MFIIRFVKRLLVEQIHFLVYFWHGTYFNKIKKKKWRVQFDKTVLLSYFSFYFFPSNTCTLEIVFVSAPANQGPDLMSGMTDGNFDPFQQFSGPSPTPTPAAQKTAPAAPSSNTFDPFQGLSGATVSCLR